MLEYVAKHSDIEVERSKQPESIAIGEGAAEHPITVNVQKVAYSNSDAKVSRNDNDIHEDGLGHSDDLEVETIKAKYVLGCDGAHSWTRRQSDIGTVGDDSDIIWGVLDIVPITDFRKFC